MRKQRLHIHIGSSKAGSSALQAYLYQVRNLLPLSNLHLPTEGFTTASGHLDLFMAIRRGYNDREIANIAKVLTASAEKGQDLILSCEGFWLLSEKQTQSLFHSFSDYEIQAYVYLRSTTHYLRSSYRQKIRMGHTWSVQEFLAREQTRQALDYHSMLLRWSKGAKVTGISYDRLDQPIGQDFLGRIGISPSELPNPEQDQINKTPPDGALVWMRTINRFPRKFARIGRKLIMLRPDFFPGTIHNAELDKFSAEANRRIHWRELHPWLSEPDLNHIERLSRENE